MDYKFLNKVVDQIVSETIIDYDQEEIYFPFSSSPPLLLLRLSAFPSLPSPLPSFTISFFKHCREVYGLNDDEIDYVWDQYKEIIIDKIIKKIENKNIIIPEGHVSNIPEDDYLNKVFNMLNHPPYLYKLESMGLSKGEVEKVFKKLFGAGVEVKYKKGKGVSILKDSQKRLLIYREDVKYEDGNLEVNPYWEKWEWYGDGEWRRYTDITGDRRLRSKQGLIIYDEHIEDCCPEELEDGFYPPLPTDINENKMNRGMDIPLLTKVAQQLISETRFAVVEFFGRNHLFLKGPMFTHGVKFSEILSKSLSYGGSVSEHIRSVYGLKWEEVNYVWLKYIDIIHQKIKKEKLPIGIQYINESRDNYSWLKNDVYRWFGEYLNQGSWYYQYILDDKFLSKVLLQLLSESKIDWADFEVGRISVTVGWDPYNKNALDVDYNKFDKHCKEVYSLSNSEVSDMWILYIMAMKKRLNQED